VDEAFAARWLPTAVGLLLAFTGIVSAGVLARGFDAYLGEFLTLPSWLVVGLFLVILGVLAGVGVRIAAGAAVVITLIEVAGLLLVLALTAEAWSQLPAKLPGMLLPADAGAFIGVGTGMVLAFYAFIGFEDMVNMAEEARRPARDLPFAIFGSLVVATLLYVLVGVAALLSLEAGALASSPAPLAAVVRAHEGPAWLVSAISLIAVVNGALVQLIMSSRVLYGLARRAGLPAWLGVVNRMTRAPSRAAIVTTVVTLLITLSLPIDRLAELTSLALLVVFASVHAALLKLGDVRRAAGVAVYWPMLGLASCCGVVLFRLVRYAM